MGPTEPDKRDAATRPGGTTLGPIAIGVVLVVAAIVGILALTRIDPWGETGSGLSERFTLDADQYLRVDPALLQFREAVAFPVAMDKVRAVATGPASEIYVAGDRAVLKFSSEGERTAEFKLGDEPSCLAVAGADHDAPGRLYIGLGQRVALLGPDGVEAAVWSEGLDEQTVLTSIALGEGEVFVADAGNRLVLRFDEDGSLLGRIGQIDPERGVRGFVIPSPYFDVAVTEDGLLRVANPGARRIEAFSFDGDHLGHWGTASADIEGFFGCCNPSNFAVLPDGQFVTAEKGIPRVKVYSDQGEFLCVVADPQTLGQTVTAAQLTEDDGSAPVFDVATDGLGRVIVLDPTTRRVRVFVRRES
jgi:hypothetical protein